jgi:hypothetical protein
MKAILLFCLIASNAFGVLPTISCRLSEDRGFIFEEGIDDYNVEIKERNTQKGFLDVLLGKTDSSVYTLAAQIPKVFQLRAVVNPSCLFNSATPLLFACGRDQIRENVKVTRFDTGAIQEFKLSAFNLASQIVRSESLDSYGKVLVEEKFKIAIRFNSPPPKGVEVWTYVNQAREFPVRDCKAGELDSSPTR